MCDALGSFILAVDRSDARTQSDSFNEHKPGLAVGPALCVGGCAGLGTVLMATRGSRSTTWPTARRPSPASSGPPARPFSAAPRRQPAAGSRIRAPRRLRRPQGSLWTSRRRAIVVRRPWGGRSSTGGPRTGGSAAPGVARLCPCGAFSHVMACTPQVSALRGTADKVLDAASESRGVGWVVSLSVLRVPGESPAPAAGVVRVSDSDPPRPAPAPAAGGPSDFKFRLGHGSSR